MFASFLLALAISLPTLVSDDVLEPSIMNEVEHALDRIPDPSVPFGIGAVSLLRQYEGNGCTVTDNAIALVSSQRADGRWLTGDEDVTAGAMWLLCKYAGLRPPYSEGNGGGSQQLRTLKQNWDEESASIEPLPRGRDEWTLWRANDARDGFEAMVRRAKDARPVLNSARRDPSNARKDWAVIAIGGSGQRLEDIWKTQGEHFLEMGLTVLAVENPPDDIARICLERGTSWLAYGTAALLPRVAELRREFPNIIWSGFSLGTEIMMSTARFAAGEGDVFVYNDFLCRNKERLIVRDSEPNGMRNITPGYFVERDFPERMLALSDHKIIFTEGGLDRDLDIVRSAFPENVTIHHQPAFADASRRWHEAELPRHLTQDAFFALCNVDPRNHYYKWELVKAWLLSEVGLAASAE